MEPGDDLEVGEQFRIAWLDGSLRSLQSLHEPKSSRRAINQEDQMTFTELAEITTAVLTSLGGGGLIVFGLSGYLGRVWADRALESTRHEHAELNLKIAHQLGLLTEQAKHTHEILALEHRVRFSNLHETRAERIAEIYKRIVALSWDCQSYVYHHSESNRQDGFNKLEEGFKDFHLFAEASRIYLPEDICMLLENLIKTVRTPAVNVFVWGDIGVPANHDVLTQKIEAFQAAFKAFEAEIPAAKKALEDEFRKLLGVEDSPSTLPIQVVP